MYMHMYIAMKNNVLSSSLLLFYFIAVETWSKLSREETQSKERFLAAERCASKHLLKWYIYIHVSGSIILTASYVGDDITVTA